MTSLFSLEGRTALVTGASRGLGFAMAQGLARSGARVILNGRDSGTLEARMDEIEAQGGKVAIAPFDVADRRAADAAIEDIEGRFGALDILVNNAAFGIPRDLFETTDDDWRRVMDVALDSCFRLTRRAASGMVRRGWGRVVMISSVNARISRGTNTAYVAAKAGLEGLTRGLAVELGPKGVTVNCIAPGYMETELNEGFRSKAENYAWIAGRTPARRWGRADELTGAAVFLASEEASYVNGHVLVVDGGMAAAI